MTMNTNTEATTTELAGQTFTAEADNGTVFLTGRRGGEYILRPFLGEQTGRYEVISLKSGAPLRDKYLRPVRVHWLGDIIEQVQA